MDYASDIRITYRCLQAGKFVEVSNWPQQLLNVPDSCCRMKRWGQQPETEHIFFMSAQGFCGCMAACRNCRRLALPEGRGRCEVSVGCYILRRPVTRNRAANH
ncbi:hypothetical protein NPIL_450481 [Nephila pilipes]|uniref:Uncharacterized protein n=1 Tax=Nephila pilipes TaxID=299642 RepID=A0A8X6NFH4_NEPPI|nr:hypothetical protein NPIL_450481 [Nephila pilipes]